MTTSTIVISDVYELLALQRGLLEARYCDIPNDPSVSASPILAGIHKRVMDAIIAANLPDGLSPDRWRQWLAIDPERREWGVALKRAAQDSSWSRLSQEDKRSFAIGLLTPFEVNDKLLDEFLSRVDEMASA